ncbi:restriction endonuclease subunit M, partial [bacterium]|nr:restriction endonuclease subunit M [bacterium]
MYFEKENLKMADFIDIKAYPVKNVLDRLLKDRTTGGNIVFASEVKCGDNCRISAETPITGSLLREFESYVMQRRVNKSLREQTERTRKRAEVFTPAWICNKMNNFCDSEWFGREGVFNIENGHSWEPVKNKISFEGTGNWQDYVDSRRLEITCGEAPYLVSRYDAAGGEGIPIERRVG